MGTREALVQRADVPDDDIDEIIAIAARLQDEAQQSEPTATIGEVEAVAAELDIDPQYVQAAIDALAAQRREADEARVEAEQAAATTRRTMGVAGLGLVGLVGGVTVLALLVFGSMVVSADTAMDAALHDLERAEGNLETVLDRQAALAPQLVALAGGDPDALADRARALSTADTLEAKLAASDALGLGLSTALGRLPATAGEQARSDLRHEISGTANRISVERRRYEDAKRAYEQASSGLAAGAARTLGLH